MFVHQSRLEHLLRPDQYFSPEQHRLELERLFIPCWHYLASKADLPRNGDFLTIELFGVPLILRNFDGDYRTFVNVCPHRHCLLTHVPRGNNARFVCQYHGWEYNKEGRTGRIPDARCFRPWDRENAQLSVVRTELCGDLIFICLDDGAPGLADYLGSHYGRFQRDFAMPYRHAKTWDLTSAANWKVFIENSLESYHVPVVHPKTFKKLPAEPLCEHVLTNRYTSFKTREDSLKFLAWSVRHFGVEATRTYEHNNIHPNLNFSCSDGVRILISVFPTSPTTCRQRVCLFTLRGENPGWLRKPLGWIVARGTTVFVAAVNKEDAAIYPDVQRGMEASSFRGVIGTREERVYVFQKYVADRCGDAAHHRAAATG